MVKQTAGRDSLGDFAPQFAQLNDDVLFGQVWNQEGLSLKLRSILTVTALVSKGLLFRSQFVPVPPDHSEAKRRHQVGNGSNFNPSGFLRRVAQRLGGVPHGSGGLSGR